MKVHDLLTRWQAEAAEPLTPHSYTIRLPLYDAAKVAALAEMYPGRTEEQLLRELLAAALDEIQAALPYIQGEQVLMLDEQGDPIHCDAGLGPTFHDRTQFHLKRLLDD